MCLDGLLKGLMRERMDTETDTDIVQADRQSDIYTEKRIGRIINTIKKKKL